MKNNSLIIMAAGASSRMKKSLSTANLNERALSMAKTQHKSLIPLGERGKPLLYYLLENAKAAAYTEIYIITSPDNAAFKDFIADYRAENETNTVRLHFAIQHIPKQRVKPLGTADALQQCLDQFPKLLEERFTVCNGDNLYSTGAFKDLIKPREAPNALIGYSDMGLQFSDERISKFAVMHIDAEGYLRDIVEKPGLDQLDGYRDQEGILRVSMNIFNFSGPVVYPFLENCEFDPVRGEKELPQAVRDMAARLPRSTYCISRSERIPDLTTADDIKNFNSYL